MSILRCLNVTVPFRVFCRRVRCSARAGVLHGGANWGGCAEGRETGWGALVNDCFVNTLCKKREVGEALGLYASHSDKKKKPCKVVPVMSILSSDEKFYLMFPMTIVEIKVCLTTPVSWPLAPVFLVIVEILGVCRLQVGWAVERKWNSWMFWTSQKLRESVQSELIAVFWINVLVLCRVAKRMVDKIKIKSYDGLLFLFWDVHCSCPC